MLESTFLREMKNRGGLDIGNYTLFTKPCVLVNELTTERTNYKNVAEAVDNAVLDGKPLKEIIKDLDMHIFDMVLDDSENKI